jgi:hypothetical protein
MNEAGEIGHRAELFSEKRKIFFSNEKTCKFTFNIVE